MSGYRTGLEIQIIQPTLDHHFRSPHMTKIIAKYVEVILKYHNQVAYI